MKKKFLTALMALACLCALTACQGEEARPCPL